VIRGVKDYAYCPAGIAVAPEGMTWNPGKEICDSPMYVLFNDGASAITVCVNDHAYISDLTPRPPHAWELHEWRFDQFDRRWYAVLDGCSVTLTKDAMTRLVNYFRHDHAP
jgi:hypothetical protein